MNTKIKATPMIGGTVVRASLFTFGSRTVLDDDGEKVKGAAQTALSAVGVNPMDKTILGVVAPGHSLVTSGGNLRHGEREDRIHRVICDETGEEVFAFLDCPASLTQKASYTDFIVKTGRGDRTPEERKSDALDALAKRKAKRAAADRKQLLDDIRTFRADGYGNDAEIMEALECTLDDMKEAFQG